MLHHVIIQPIVRKKIFKDKTAIRIILSIDYVDLCLNGIDPTEVFLKNRCKPRFDAKVLFCYWASRELKIPLTDLAQNLN